MPANYVLLETIDLTQSAASVTFDNIPQTGYTDLKIVVSARDSDTSGALTQVSFNGVTTNLSSRRLRGTGSAATSTAFASNIYTQGQANGDTANTFGNSEIYIPNYTSSNYKSVSEDGVSENNATAAYMQLTAGLWSSPAAVTSVTLTSAAGPYLRYSTFSLYGIAAFGTTPTIGPKATGGNIVANDGTYWYHAFLTTGTFTPTFGLTCDVLVVAGGGGGSGGGGGAGGLLPFTSQSITGASTVTVGAGGAGTNNVTTNGSNGSDSRFAALTLVKGGGGGAHQASGGVAGSQGSGGGAGYDSAAGTATSGQGNSGGTATTSPQRGNGGGGGSVGVGANGTGSGGGNGGVGSSTYSSWGSATTTGQNVGGTYYYAGGGGGGNFSSDGSPETNGSGGSGGGGASSNSLKTNGTGGTASTGGGGGGATDGPNPTIGTVGGTGGSGIVIIRYAMA